MRQKPTEFIWPEQHAPHVCVKPDRRLRVWRVAHGLLVCVGVKLEDATRAALREQYQGCSCRDCLERFAAPATMAEADEG